MVLSPYCIKQLRDSKSYMPKTTSLGLGGLGCGVWGGLGADGFGVKFYFPGVLNVWYIWRPGACEIFKSLARTCSHDLAVTNMAPPFVEIEHG